MSTAELPPDEPERKPTEEGDIDWQPQEVPPFVGQTARSLAAELFSRFCGPVPNLEGVTDEKTREAIEAYAELVREASTSAAEAMLPWVHEAAAARQRITDAQAAADKTSKDLESSFLAILEASGVTDPFEPPEGEES